MNTFNVKEIRKTRLLVVANDVGGANILLSFISNEGIHCDGLLSGPAKESIIRYPSCKINLVEKLNPEYDIILIGSGWMTSLELEAINFAQSRGIKYYVFLDHYVNYRERFLRNENKILPINVVVFDIKSYRIAEKIFRNIYFLENQYFKHLEKTYFIGVNPEIDYLILSEPIKDHLGTVDELSVIGKCVKDLKRIDSKVIISIRLHPSEKRDKYQSLINEYEDILLFENRDLVHEISMSKNVIGFETYALHVANHFGRKTYTLLEEIPNHLPNEIKLFWNG